MVSGWNIALVTVSILLTVYWDYDSFVVVRKYSILSS